MESLSIQKYSKLNMYHLNLFKSEAATLGKAALPRKRCSEIMQQIYRRTLMPKCDFNKVALQLY